MLYSDFELAELSNKELFQRAKRLNDHAQKEWETYQHNGWEVDLDLTTLEIDACNAIQDFEAITGLSFKETCQEV